MTRVDTVALNVHGDGGSICSMDDVICVCVGTIRADFAIDAKSARDEFFALSDYAAIDSHVSGLVT